jgi:hypothetical protein
LIEENAKTTLQGRSPRFFLNPANQKGNLILSPVDVNESLILTLIPTGLVLGMEGLGRLRQGASSPAMEKGQHINCKNAF